MKVTISSLPGAGSSTIARLLAKELNLGRIDAGEIWDRMAKARRQNVLTLNLEAEKDNSIDYALDEKMLEYAQSSNNLLLEGRLCGWLCYKNKIPAFKVWFSCFPNVRAKRIASRERADFNKILKETLAREESEAKRFKMYYSIDINDLSIYDLVIDTSNMTPDEIVRFIVLKLRTKQFKKQI